MTPPPAGGLPVPARDIPAPLPRPPRRPLVGTALVFLGGVAAGLVLSLPALLPAGCAVLALGWGTWRRWRGSSALAAFHVAVAMTGMLRAVEGTAVNRGAHLAGRMDRDAEHLQLQGTVRSDPYFVPPGSNAEAGAWRFDLRVRAVNRTGDLQAARGNVACRLRADPTAIEPAYGDVWELSGVVYRVSAPGPASLLPPSLRMEARAGESHRLARDRGHWLVARCLAGRRACHRNGQRM